MARFLRVSLLLLVAALTALPVGAAGPAVRDGPKTIADSPLENRVPGNGDALPATSVANELSNARRPDLTSSPFHGMLFPL